MIIVFLALMIRAPFIKWFCQVFHRIFGILIFFIKQLSNFIDFISGCINLIFYSIRNRSFPNVLCINGIKYRFFSVTMITSLVQMIDSLFPINKTFHSIIIFLHIKKLLNICEQLFASLVILLRNHNLYILLV